MTTNGTENGVHHGGRRAVIDAEEQIPRLETIALRKKHVGPSCKLFFNKGTPVMFLDLNICLKALPDATE